MTHAIARSPKTNKTSRWMVAAPMAAAAVALVAAGCSSTTPKAAANAAPGGQTGAAAAATPAAVGIRTTPLGNILTNAKGLTVYLFEKDTGTTSTCYGSCASVWPPVTTTSGATPSVATGLNQALVGTTTRTDGTTQITYGGHPLYLFAGDQNPGQTTGQGLKQFGAPWYVLTADGKKIDNG